MASLTGTVSLSELNSFVWNLDFETDVSTTATLVITGGGSQRVLSFDGLSTDHELPLFGLKVDTAYSVDVLVTDAGGNTSVVAQNLTLQTDDVYFDPVESVNVDETDKMEEGYTVLKNSHFVLDNEGDLVFQGIDESRFIDELTIVRDPARILEIANQMGVTFSPYSLISIGFTPDNTGILVSDLMGNYAEIPSDVFDVYQGLHHDVYLTDDNTILTFGNVPYYVPFFPAGPTDPTLVPNVKLKDQPLIEVGLDGTIINTWSIAELVDQERTGYLGWNVHGKGLDWLHMNAVEPVPGEDAFIVSARHQDAVLKFTTDGQLLWILGNHDNWGPEFQPYLLTPVGDNFTWQYHQHAANLASDGDILLFDNGNYKASPFDGITPVADEDNWSRAARYEVDEATMTVKLVWEYDANKELFGESGGDVNELPNGNILVNFTNVTYRDGEPTPDVLGTQYSAQLVEINPTTGEVVYDVTLGVTTYRAERIPSLYNEHVDEALNVSDFKTGDSGPNSLLGGDGKQLFLGGAGDDTLSGLAGDDTIYGDAGDDNLVGGSGDDSLNGGDGTDTAVIGDLRRASTITEMGDDHTVQSADGTDTLDGSTEILRFLDGDLYFGADNAAAQVNRLYLATLDREPDAVGLSHWTDTLEAGTTLLDLVNAFLASPEWQAKYGALDNGGFVTALYHNVLDRDPDQGGYDHWTGLLDANSLGRPQLVLNFSESPEFKQNTAGDVAGGLWAVDDDAAFVLRAYKVGLDRDPDAGGLAYWIEALHNGTTRQEMSDAFANAPEFVHTYGTLTNQQFVEQMYLNALDRPGDTPGVGYWTAYLNDGAARGMLVTLFAESPELVANTEHLVSDGLFFV